jgi:hypothetical protein
MEVFVKTFIDKTPHLRQAGGSHDNFPPRTTIFHLASYYLFAQEVSASDHLFARVVSASN